VRRPGARPLVGLAAAGLILIASGCGAGDPLTSVSPSPSASAPVSPASPAPVVIPSDGVALRAFGYTNGPVDEFSLPRDTTLVAAVDQSNNVTAVLSFPPPADVVGYLRKALPAAGFSILTADPSGSAVTFAGHGWRGSFTSDTRASAILLRPG
jgi:hypothetical protein